MKNLFYLVPILLVTISSCSKPAPPAGIVYQDALTTDNHTWPVDSTTYHVRKFDQGHYTITVKSPNISTYSLAPYGTINFAYTVQLDGTTVLDSASQPRNVAVIFNFVDNNNFAVAEIWTNGMYRIWTWANSQRTIVADYTLSTAIITGPGSKNTIKVIQNQTIMELKVNNVSMGVFVIALPSSAVQTGPAVANGASNFAPVTGLFNNFSIARN
jgi:hypothetical protein